MDVRSKLDQADDYQQHHHKTSIAVATYKKFSDDRSTNLASMIAFWAFFSIFPLILVLITLLSWFLSGDTKDNVLTSVANFFPLLDPSTVGSLSGSWWTLVVGLVSALWSGMAVVKALQYAFNSVWEVPMAERPKLAEKLVRSVEVLATVGLGLVVATAISSFVTGNANDINLPWFGRLGGYVVSAALDVGIFIVLFRMLTDRSVSIKEQLPGALLSGGAFFVLQEISSYIISNRLSSAQSTYGHFATVITMLWWFYLQGQLTLLGAQLNVVLRGHLYPRALVGAPDTPGDKRAYEAYAEEHRFLDNQEVSTGFTSDGERPHGGARQGHGIGSGDRDD